MNKLKNNKGFTLVELLVAIAILGIVIAPLANSFIMSAKINTMAKLDAEAMNIAQGYMEQIKALSEFPVEEDGSASYDISNLFPYDNTETFTVTATLTPTTYKNGYPDDQGGGTGAGGNTAIQPPSGDVIKVFFNNSNTPAISDPINNIIILPVKDFGFIFKDNKLYFTTEMDLKNKEVSEAELNNMPNITYTCNDDYIRFYLDPTPDEIGTNANIGKLTQSVTCISINKNDETQKAIMQIIKPDGYAYDINSFIKEGLTSVTYDLLTDAVDVVADCVMYNVEIIVEYKYDNQDEMVTVKGEKIF